MRIDELNYFDKETDFIDIDQYFDEMDLTDEQKENRKNLANDLQEAVLFLFALLSIFKENQIFSYAFILEQFKIRYKQEVQQYVEIDEKLEQYINDISTSIVTTCFTHLDAFVNSQNGAYDTENSDNDNYYSSNERAVLIAENEASSVMNYNDYQKAIEEGYTRKKWLTMKDNRVRKTHKEVDNQVIPIKDYFIVGNAVMLYPHSVDAPPEEVIGCRCSIKYLK